MKFLFVHQNFPAQFLHLIRHLVLQNKHEIVFITEPNDNVMPGGRKIPYKGPQPASHYVHWTIRELDQAVRRSESVAATARSLRELGFNPNIIIGHHGWGELLSLQDVWPSIPILGYYEFFYHTDQIDVGFDPEFPTAIEDFPRIRAKNAVNLLALAGTGHGQTPTAWQLSTYPEWARGKITLLPEGVELGVCKPDVTGRNTTLQIGGWEIGPDEPLVTYVARDLEPYRGFHTLLRALPRLFRKRRDARVVMVGGDGVSYGSAPRQGSWKDHFLAQMEDKLDLSRVHFPGRIQYSKYVRLLQRSDAHVYLTYPFVASWSLREALAIGCAVIGSDTPPVREFIQHQETGLLAPFLKPDEIADAILQVLEDRYLANRLRTGARIWAEANLAMPEYLASYGRLISRLVGDKAEPLTFPSPELFDDTHRRLKYAGTKTSRTTGAYEDSTQQPQPRVARRR